MLCELIACGGMKQAQGDGSTKPPPSLRYKENWGNWTWTSRDD